MKQLIVPTGYMGSGSSAATDIISEIDGYRADNGTFEYVFLHCPGGVFDLEDKLLLGNNALRSDEALHTFEKTMRQLYDKKYWWVGNYEKRVSPRFMELTEAYINRLIMSKPDFYWYQQENTNFRMFCQLCLRRLVSYLTFGQIKLKKPLLYPEIWLSLPSPEEFYQISQEYITSILIEMGIEEKNLILDQLLLPFNLFRVDHYFGDNLHVFNIYRDPRDVFIINKYIWPGRNETVPFPTDAEAFSSVYRRIRTSERACESTKVHRFAFEDLIYHYEESLTRIYDCLGVTAEMHVAKGTAFQPEKSIENTQLFLADAVYQEEADRIAEMLPEYLYDFPYPRVPKTSQTF